MPIFIEISLIVVLATLIAMIMKALRQPLIVGYIATGILVGPYALNILSSHDEIELFSKIGISILLFIVGLSLNPDIIREVGKTSLITGIGQVLFTSFFGYLIMRFLGYGEVASLYTAIALTFSSTIIILKLLTDRGDMGKLYGKIAIGFLLVQDLVATIILLVVSVVGAKGASELIVGSGGVVGAGGVNTEVIGATFASTAGAEILSLFIKGLVVAVVLYIISKYILPRLSHYIAGNQEVLFIFSIAWGLGLASLFYYIGFSIEIGALVAGVTLAVSPFAYEIGARMKPLRDFFILLFFILLGAQMILSELSTLIVPAIILSLFVLVGNPIIVYVLMNVLGYRSKTSFMAGLTVAQISEFSLILAALGLSLGHIDTSVASLITLVGIITIAGSTYLILYADFFYKLVKTPFSWLHIRKKSHAEPRLEHISPEIIIFGYDRVGQDFVETAKDMTDKYVVVDFDPVSVRKLQATGVPFRYGDAEDVEFLQEIDFHQAKLIVSTIPDFKTNLLLVQFYRKENPTGIIMTLAHEIKHAKELYLSGASYVVMPHFLGAHHASKMISKYGFDISSFEEIRNEHLVHLQKKENNIKSRHSYKM
jgi:Kef-type K+ transport system membrane component KefB/Trk K+ transport system NAD-binding subunit